MRNPLDHYDSPGWFVTHLPNYITLDGVVGEPCSGAGNLSSILPHFKNVQSVWTNDINRNLKADSHFDATNPRSWLEFPETDWVVTNPPFNQAFQILRNAFFFAKKGVVFLSGIHLQNQQKNEVSGSLTTPAGLTWFIQGLSLYKTTEEPGRLIAHLLML